MYELVYWRGMFWDANNLNQEKLESRQALVARMCELAKDLSVTAVAGSPGAYAVGSVHKGVVVIESNQLSEQVLHEATAKMPWRLEERQLFDQMRYEIEGLRQKVEQLTKQRNASARIAGYVMGQLQDGEGILRGQGRSVEVTIVLDMEDVEAALAAWAAMQREGHTDDD